VDIVVAAALVLGVPRGFFAAEYSMSEASESSALIGVFLFLELLAAVTTGWEDEAAALSLRGFVGDACSLVVSSADKGSPSM
jgi:hypothetical protein